MAKRNMVAHALECIQNNPIFFSKFLTSNDVGANGSHQAGIYIHKNNGKSMYPEPFKKGENVHVDIVIKWFDSELEDNCKFIYYGRGLRTNEFRLTCLSRKFKLGDFFLIVKAESEYIGFVFDEHQSKSFLIQLSKLAT